MGSERYFLTVVDEYSSYCEVIPVQQKSSIAQELIAVIERWERQCDAKVKVVRTDRGTEFLNKTFHGYCSEKGIHTEMSAAYTPQQNGTAERMNRTIKEKARTLLLGVDADMCLWDEAVKTAAHLHNVMPISDKAKTPLEEFTGAVPNLSGLRRWGCLAYVKREKHQTHTLGAQSVVGMFVGYDPHTKGYRVRVGDKVIVSRNVHFVEGKSGAIAIGRCMRGSQPRQDAEAEIPAANDNADEVMDEGEPFEISIPTSVNPFGPLLDLDNNASDETTSTTSPSQLPSSTVPEQGTSTSTCDTSQRLPNMIDKTRAAGREVDAAPTPSSGTRARSRQVLRLMMGYPIKLQTHKGGVKGKRVEADRPPPLSREERLLQRNAKKEALQEIPESEIVAGPTSGDVQVTEVEVGGEVTVQEHHTDTCMDSDTSESACEVQVGEKEGGDESSGESGEAIANVANVQGHSAISMSRCESERENLLLNARSSCEEVRGKAVFFDQVCDNSAGRSSRTGTEWG
jgi:hypothetical protein